MSVCATIWAWKQNTGRTSAKLILLSLADRANEDHQAYPSIKRLVLDTELDKKTVQKGIVYLIDRGFIADTGERKGQTRQVKVLQLLGVNGRDKLPENGNVPKNGNDPKNGLGNDPKNGAGKGTQKRDTEPTSKNLPLEPNNKTGLDLAGLPGWLSEKAISEFIQHRKEIKTPLTQLALTKLINQLAEFKAQGHDPIAMLDNSIANGWRGVFAPKGNASRPAAFVPDHNDTSWIDGVGGVL